MEVTVGAFMFMILLALGFFTIVLSRQNLFTTTYHHEVLFNNVKGLREGDNVFLRGVAVGKIKRLQIKPEGVVVGLNLEVQAVLHEDYRIEILPASVLGGRYLNIYEGSDSLPLLAKGTLIRGIPPVDLIDEATRTTQLIKKALEEGGILENLKTTMVQLKDITTRLSAGEGTLGKMLVDDSVYTNLQGIVSNLRDVSERLNSGKGTMGRLLSEDDTLYEDLRDTVASLKEVSGKISGGEGSLGKFVMSDELYQEVRLLLHEVQATVDDYRETVPITTFTSILFGAF